VALAPVALEFCPSAIASLPVAAAGLQMADMSVPAAPEVHCANAGETPAAITAPTAARLRNVPPLRTLVESNAARADAASDGARRKPGC
jgi:hypothetical protein